MKHFNLAKISISYSLLITTICWFINKFGKYMICAHFTMSNSQTINSKAVMPLKSGIEKQGNSEVVEHLCW